MILAIRIRLILCFCSASKSNFLSLIPHCNIPISFWILPSRPSTNSSFLHRNHFPASHIRYYFLLQILLLDQNFKLRFEINPNGRLTEQGSVCVRNRTKRGFLSDKISRSNRAVKGTKMKRLKWKMGDKSTKWRRWDGRRTEMKKNSDELR